MGRWDKKSSDYSTDDIVKNHIHFDDPQEEYKALKRVATSGIKAMERVLDAMEHNDCNLYKHNTFMCDGECRCTCHWKNKIYKLGKIILPSLFKRNVRRYKDDEKSNI